MANVFDQFDVKPAANVFDQFDAPAAPEPSSTLGDVTKSFGSGLVRGTAETAMLPVTAKRLADSGANWLFDKGEGLVRSVFGMDDPSAETLAARDQARGVIGAMDAPIYAGQDAIRGGMDKVLHKPETMAGKFANTIGEFAAPGAIPGKAVRTAPTAARAIGRYAGDAIGNVVAPAVLSEGAGQLTEGTAAEPYARIVGALFGSGATAVARGFNAPDAIVRRAAGKLDDADWDAALNLQNNATGIRLTGPEAIAQATGGASALPNLQRVIEGSTEGRAATAPFFAARPAQVDTAVGRVLDNIAPQDASPSTLGLRMSQAASKAMENTPEGQDLVSAIFGAGPRTTAMEAGDAIQQPLRGVFDRREGMRNALGDQEFTAARQSAPTIPVESLQPEAITRDRGVFSLKPQAGAEGEVGAMVPQVVKQDLTPPALESQMGPAAIQADPRELLRFIDDQLPNAKAATTTALERVRGMLMGPNGAHTSVAGLDNARGEITAMITAAKQNGEGVTIDILRKVQQQLDKTLESVPAYAKAQQGFRAGSKPLEPFQNPAMSKAIERDEFNSHFLTTPENVPATLQAGGPSAARAFNEVAPQNSRVAYENYLSTQIMDSATDASGKVSADRLAIALRDNQDLLSQYPAVAERLSAIVGADAGMAGRRASPLGQIAGTNNTASASEALLPRNPQTGSAAELGDTARRLVAEAPSDTAATVRQNLGDRFSKAGTETMEGNREFAGAKFHKDVAGNPTREEVLDAVLREMPGAPNVDMAELLDVLQATGRRKQIGSATAFNEGIKDEMSRGGVLGAGSAAVKTLGLNVLTRLNDAAKRGAQNRSMGALAHMFTDPRSVELIRDTTMRGMPIDFAEAVARSTAQTLPIVGRAAER
ncbi:hypothetical protein [Kaistia sp. UC242_56]|uniref:hypothetical protein n=1 Tax=Kaistia sp. UC242_56 TaxID=3374625 RepID=UPI0037A70F03